MILESKLNHMSLEELEEEKPNSALAIFNYLVDDDMNLSHSLAKYIAVRQANRPDTKSDVIGVWHETKLNCWRSARQFNGRKVFIKAAMDKNSVEAAAIEFAKKNNLQIYR